jgi:hypothetical protein
MTCFGRWGSARNTMGSYDDDDSNGERQYYSRDDDSRSEQRYHSREDDESDRRYYSRGNDGGERRNHSGRNACFGSCFAGTCKLDQTRPGCCYASGSTVARDAREASKASATTAVVGSYGKHGRGLVCWRDESDEPHFVHTHT